MASPGLGNALNGHKLGSPFEIGERSNAVDVSEFYEDLFENEGNELPCYLPDSGQEEDNLDLENDHDDMETPGTAISGILSEERQLESPKMHSGSAAVIGNRRGSGMSTHKGVIWSDSSSSGSENEPPEKEEDGDMAGTESSSGGRTVSSDGGLSSDRGPHGLPCPSGSQGCTSGYIAGSGSSSGDSSIDVEGVTRVGRHKKPKENGSSEAHRAWKPGKRHPNEVGEIFILINKVHGIKSIVLC